jgi:hypothetical protein
MIHNNLESFTSQWSLDEIPACPVGIELLYAFSRSVDEAVFELALQADMRGLPVAEDVQPNPLWGAYAAHTNSCAGCNEI